MKAGFAARAPIRIRFMLLRHSDEEQTCPAGGGSMADRLERWTCNSETPSSSRLALTTPEIP